MSSSIAVNTIQVISAFVMFIVGYLALLLSIIVCFVIASFICMGATVASAYTVRCSLGENCEKSESGVKEGLTTRLGWGFRLQRAAAALTSVRSFQHQTGRNPT